MQRRRELMAIHTEEIPAIYKRVEYIETASNGEYIDTGFVGNMGTCVETKFNLLAAEGNPAVIGSRVSSARFSFPVYYNGFDLAIRTDNTGGVWNLNTIYTARIITENDNSRMNISGPNGYNVEINNPGYANNNIPLFIFRYNRNGTPDENNKSSLRLYYLKLYNGGIGRSLMVRNFIPCIRKSDNKPGMYDTVSKTFFTNAGTGEFIVPA